MISIEALHLCRRVAWLVCIVHAEPAHTPHWERADGTPRGAFQQCGMLPGDTVTSGQCDSERWCGGPSNEFTFRSFKHIQAVVVVQHGTLEEDAWEREEEEALRAAIEAK